MRRGPLEAGEKVQFTDRRSNKITDQLVPGGVTQTSHGIILHDEVIGRTEGSVIVTVSVTPPGTSWSVILLDLRSVNCTFSPASSGPRRINHSFMFFMHS